MLEKYKTLFSNAYLWLAERLGHTKDGDGEPNLERRMLLTKGLAAAAVVFVGLSIVDTAEAANGPVRRNPRRRNRPRTRTHRRSRNPRRRTRRRHTRNLRRGRDRTRRRHIRSLTRHRRSLRRVQDRDRRRHRLPRSNRSRQRRNPTPRAR